MAFIVWPALVGTARFSPVGLAAALAAGWIFAFFQVVVKEPARQLPYETLVTAQCLLDLIFILPFGLWQFLGTPRGLTVRDCIAGLAMGLVATALANGMWWRGVAHISVQHSSILGLITPVAAAVYAFIFHGQSLSAPTIVGGVFILCAGGLVVFLGSGGTEPQTPP
jgi:drug/metabolite transporter (DMT)-like permease